MIDQVIARLKDRAPGLASRVEGAAAFSAMMQRGQLPQVTPAAHVIPVGLSGGPVDSAANVFTQRMNEVIGVVLTVRSNDQAGARGVEPIEQLKSETIAAIAGWAPNDDIVGVFRLSSGRMLSVQGGAIVYQLDFAIEDQLRITS
jgi:hypothetical protein